MMRWEERHWQVKTPDLAAQFVSLRYGEKELVEARSLSLSKCPRFALRTVLFDLRRPFDRLRVAAQGAAQDAHAEELLVKPPQHRKFLQGSFK